MLKYIAIGCVLLAGCASDDMKGMGEAASKAASGEASGKAGAIESKIVGGYMPGDIWAPDVKAQRNANATKSGDVFSAVTLNVAGGANALREAIQSDPVLLSLQAEIASLGTSQADSRPTDRLDMLRQQIATRLAEIEEAFARAAPHITIGDVKQEVHATANVGKDPPVLTAEDAKLADGMKPAIENATSMPVK